MESPEDYAKAFFIEVKKMASPGLDVGLWAFSPTANVVGRPISSWFPILPESVDQEIRHHCHRMFLPADPACQALKPMTILWMQSNADANSFDHFVAVVR